MQVRGQAYLAARRPSSLDRRPERWPGRASLRHVPDVEDDHTVPVRLVALDAHAASTLSTRNAAASRNVRYLFRPGPLAESTVFESARMINVLPDAYVRF
jgi:hypothetical protein